MNATINVIILSNTKSEEIRQMTEACLKSLFESEGVEEIEIRALVIESNRNFAGYSGDRIFTIFPIIPFGYNSYMNIGIKASAADFVCLSNNDLIFHKNWAKEILLEMQSDPELVSACPYCPRFHPTHGFHPDSPPLIGYDNGVLIGWCIFVKRSIFSITGLLDEKFTFWYCDNDFGLTLKKYGLKHCLISSSVVEHLVNRTLSTCDTKEFQRLTSFQQLYFDLKWKHGSRIKYYWFMFLCKMKFAYRRFKTGLRNCMTYLKQMLVNGVNLACRTVMARRSFYRLNCFLFHLSVKGMGLNNYECSTGAEELFFSRILTKLFDASAQITVFDIGANVGEYSTALKRHLPNALIYAFEPHPKTYIKLKNLGGQKFLTYNIGFSNTMGEGYLYDHLNADGSQHASIHSGVIERIHGTPAIKHTIQIETIDNFICTNGIKHIHFIKIDTEGNDINVLRGALNSIKTGVIDVIQFEFNTMNIVSRTFMKDAFELLGDYQLFRMLPRGLLPLRHYFTDSCELFMFQNIVCVRKNLQSDIV